MMHDQSAIALVAERLEVTDALLRFGAGVDHNGGELLATAFSDDAIVDFGPCGRAIGLDFPVLTGGDTVLRFLRATAEAQTTTHVITNGRARIEGSAARLHVLVDATHLPKSDHSRRCQMMHWYDVGLVKDENFWRMRRIVISNAWFTGDIQVLLGK